MRIIFFTVLFIIAFISDGTGQKFMIIERAGTPKTERIPLFDHLTFQLKDDDDVWYTRQIFDLNADAQLVLLGDAWLPISDISRIHLKRRRALASVIGGAMQGGGASMMLGDLYYTIRNNHRFTDGGIEFGLANIALGTALKSLLGPIKYRLGTKTRLRVIDVTIHSGSKT